MRRYAVALALFLASCGEDEAFQRRIAATFTDPDAVQFKDFAVRGDKACGQVNAKNTVGGYVGFRPFVTRMDNTGLWIDYGPDQPLSRQEYDSRKALNAEVCDYQKKNGSKLFHGCELQPKDDQQLAQTTSFVAEWRACTGRVTLGD